MADIADKAPSPADAELVEFSNTQEAVSYTREEERRYETLKFPKDIETTSNNTLLRIVRKIDARIMPTTALIYLLCYLDRGNIGTWCHGGKAVYD